MRAVGGDVTKELQADVLASTVEGGDVGCARDERGVEDVAFKELVIGPGSAEEGRHYLSNIGDAIGFGEGRGLLGLADVLSGGVVEGHLMP